MQNKISESLRRNGYKPSLFATESHFCFYCGRYGDVVPHELVYGRGRRELCKEDGLYVFLCPACHKWEHEVGLERDGVTLKQMAQMAYERTHTREEFIKRYGRNYL